MRHLLISALLLLFAVPASAQISPAGKKLLSQIKMSMLGAKMAKKPRCFDGNKLGSANPNSCKWPMGQFKKKVDAIEKNWKKLSAADKGSSEAKAYATKVEGLIKWRDGWKAALSGQSSGTKNAKAQCEKFERNVVQKFAKARFLVELKNKKDGGKLKDADHIKAVAAHAKEVARLCATPEFKGVGVKGCGDSMRPGPAKSAKWCAAAGEAQALIQKAVTHYVKSDVVRRSKHLGDPADGLKKRGGWLQTDQPVTWKGYMYFGEARKKALIAKYQPLYAAASMKFQADEGWWSAQATYTDKQRAAVEKVAPGLKAPKSTKKKHYSTALMKASLKKTHPSAKIKKLWMAKESWQVEKNGAGYPVKRRWHAFAFYKLPGEKFCQLRQWYVMEKHSGGGKYAKSAEVHWRDVRYQSCR
jgi:hypothetical protein